MGDEPSTTRRPGRPRADSSAVPAERDVLRRGLEAFATLGYDRASARELARRLGVGPTFINDRYGSKAAYWRAVVDAALGAQLGNMAPPAPGSDDADVVRQFVTEFYRVSIDEPYLTMLMADESARETERFDYLYERYIGPTLALVLPSIERLMASGGMTRVPPDIVFVPIIAPVSGLVREPLARRLGRPERMQHADRLARAEALAKLVVDGLLTTKHQ
ncbi:hypothetical protein TPA0910_30710 [Streptomyces hygroscopicus subsp. sporocinereus]|uniref:HTH tetR-type domain-containing protein n=1 Tax=Streptomyces hygroscopicus TaxID=1912 RepID=A0ABQ3TZ35_STRHY|nr:hypothetical protein TPA0910_30710 [Streptomyces hygroscopicus]